MTDTFPEPARRGLRGARVLVVDDDPPAREAITDILELQAVEVTVATDTASGLRLGRALAGRLDAIVLDLFLPDAPRADVVSPWRKACPGAGLLLVSGADADLAERLAGPSDGWHLLLKPFGMDELLAALSAVLPLPEQRRGRPPAEA